MKIREARIKKGLSQLELANLIGATQAAISKWEIGERFPRRKTLDQIAHHLGVSVAYLMGEDDDECNEEIKKDKEFQKAIDEKRDERFQHVTHCIADLISVLGNCENCLLEHQKLAIRKLLESAVEILK